MARCLAVHALGRVPYGEAHALQEALLAARRRGAIGDVLLLVEHPPVITLGRSAKSEHLLFSEEMLRLRGVEVHPVGRGGDVTFHGPGQLVAYPIVDLKPDRCDVRRYVGDLEAAMIATCAHYGVVAKTAEGMHGTWVGKRKVGAVGVRLREWVTMHGVGLNVNTDLSFFDLIVPCGIREYGVTSLERELGRTLPLDEVGDVLAEAIGAALEADVRSATKQETASLSLHRAHLGEADSTV